MTILTLIAEIRAKPGKEDEVRELLQSLVEPTRAEEGCLNYDLHAANDDPAFFALYENWASKELWDQHMQSPHLQAFSARTEDLVADWKLHQLTKLA